MKNYLIYKDEYIIIWNKLVRITLKIWTNHLYNTLAKIDTNGILMINLKYRKVIYKSAENGKEEQSPGHKVRADLKRLIP